MRTITFRDVAPLSARIRCDTISTEIDECLLNIIAFSLKESQRPFRCSGWAFDVFDGVG